MPTAGRSQTTSGSSDFYRSGGRKPAVESKLARFEAMNAWVRAKGGWVTSLPGAPEIEIEVLPDSTLPDALRAAGYDLKIALHPHGQRTLPDAVVEEVLTHGSTVVRTVRHAGVWRVDRFVFRMD